MEGSGHKSFPEWEMCMLGVRGMGQASIVVVKIFEVFTIYSMRHKDHVGSQNIVYCLIRIFKSTSLFWVAVIIIQWRIECTLYWITCLRENLIIGSIK